MSHHQPSAHWISTSTAKPSPGLWDPAAGNEPSAMGSGVPRGMGHRPWDSAARDGPSAMGSGVPRGMGHRPWDPVAWDGPSAFRSGVPGLRTRLFVPRHSGTPNRAYVIMRFTDALRPIYFQLPYLYRTQYGRAISQDFAK